ncbi:hypothetical protein AAFF_G00413970 [Aldrovandia affinis]|uniref:Uncharacterized protein n=1 Tax=Aldrovandia affinis TaxID=143900 RepID=A0AAD7WKH5_9TELE|nr:hypothetical protein AAFF_G00413970 [Aldrovandia affinis]
MVRRVARAEFMVSDWLAPTIKQAILCCHRPAFSTIPDEPPLRPEPQSKQAANDTRSHPRPGAPLQPPVPQGTACLPLALSGSRPSVWGACPPQTHMGVSTYRRASD